MLLEELARVRRRGFSTAFGEHEPNINAIAVPVFNHRATVVAALEIRGLSTRITPSRVPELVERARTTAAAITDRIGGVSASM
jgi:DNA-binding IclR family transcriptional regulator